MISVLGCLINVLFSQIAPASLSCAGEYAGTQGLGLLRLHSTYRHDLKIYASDEGRVQMTAAAFAKGLLALEVKTKYDVLFFVWLDPDF